MPTLIVFHDDGDCWLIGDGVNDPSQDDARGAFFILFWSRESAG
jgi:hypothetical protein